MTNIEKAIKVVKSECYVNSPLNMDRSIMINEALDILIEVAQKYDEECKSHKEEQNGESIDEADKEVEE